MSNNAFYFGTILAVVFAIACVAAAEVGKARANEAIAKECIKAGGEWIQDTRPPFGCLRYSGDPR